MFHSLRKKTHMVYLLLVWRVSTEHIGNAPCLVSLSEFASSLVITVAITACRIYIYNLPGGSILICGRYLAFRMPIATIYWFPR